MRKSELVRVTFEPDGIEIYVPSGTLLSKAAAAYGRAVETPCGGIGICGKCKVVVTGAVTQPDSTERERLTEDELKNGVRLACMAAAVGEVRVEIPESSRSTVQKILSKGAHRECEVLSNVKKVYCELEPPSLEDEQAAFELIADHLKAQNIDLKPNLDVLHTLSPRLEKAGYKVTAVVYDDELIGIESGDTSSKCYGIAYDLGSTTIVGYLMNLTTGEEMAVSSIMNPQMIYGDDLISRISFASTEANGATILQSSAVDAFNRIAKDLTKTAGINAEHVYKVTVVGNTCMTHLLLGIDTASLGRSPFVPTVCSDITVSSSDLCLHINPEAKVVVLPNIAGFVGSDMVGVLLSNMFEDDGSTHLAVDIGTNGEMALMHNGRLYVCSAAAGPAFEGAGISCGMRGADGAIDSVIVDGDVHITTIHNKRPLGLCGSGLVDAVAQMLKAGILDESGRIVSPEDAGKLPQELRDRIVKTGQGIEFVIATAEESGTGKAVTITSTDIRRLQLAKGSIHAAIQTLLKTADITDDDLDRILLAGAFGSYIRVESAIRIGLIPNISQEKVVSIGNAAGSGSKLALLCEKEMELAKKLAQMAEHIELAVSPDYQMELMERMMFPDMEVVS